VAVEGTPALAAVDQVIGEIRLQSTAYCADLPSNNTANGTQFQVYDCHGGSVFVVRLRGDFRATGFSVPAGHAIPTGTVLTVTVDAATGEMTDWSLGGDTKPLTALGAVTNRVL
jgi:hypothetical protein